VAQSAGPETSGGIDETRIADSTGNWVDTRAPAWLKPYLRLARFDRPIGAQLLLMPCWWSAAQAAGVSGRIGFAIWTIILFWIGAFVMRGAGCVWNDITDRDLDASVERTRKRPIPSGQVSVKQALAFMALLALIGLVVLLQFNAFAVFVGIASLGIVAIYPFMKRITYWPQIVLGLAFSWGALQGWAVTFGNLQWPAFLLYAGSISWVIGYDTIYAHQDRDDDALIGIRSTALLFGERTKPMLALFFGLALVLIGLSFWLTGARIFAWLGLAAFAAHLIWQIRVLDISDWRNCLKLFRANHLAGLILFAGLVCDALLRAYG